MYKSKYQTLMNKFMKYLNNERFVANFIGKEFTEENIDKIENDFLDNPIIQQIKTNRMNQKEYQVFFDYVISAFLKALLDSNSLIHEENEEYIETVYQNPIIKFNITNTERKKHMFTGEKSSTHILKIKTSINNKIFKEQ